MDDLWRILRIVFYFLWLLQCQYIIAAVEIKCIPVKLCPMAMKLIKNRPYDPQTIGFLRYSHCGFDKNRQAKIWCTQFKSCLTPDSQQHGICKNIKECDSYIDLMRNVDIRNPVIKKYLREFRCNTEFDREIKICCPQEKIINRSILDDDDDDDDINLFKSDTVHNRLSKPISPKNEYKECGRQNQDNRIFGGTETYLDEFPWMVLLKYIKDDIVQDGCSGALINERYVLTAAHCVDVRVTRRKRVGDLYKLILGEYDTRNQTDCIFTDYGDDCADPVQEFDPERIIIHPEFDLDSVTNDIALVRLDRKAKLTNYVRTICLPPRNFQLRGNESFTISGWGRTETVQRSPVKMKVSLRYSPKEKCENASQRRLIDRQICIGDGKGSESCYGDSGGPLMLEQRIGNEFVSFVIGIVSYGIGQVCGALPGVYTYLPPYIEWIYQNIG